jgi:hypothetical protein
MSSARIGGNLLAITGLFALSACSGTGFYDVGALNGGGNSGTSFGGAPNATDGGAGAPVNGGASAMAGAAGVAGTAGAAGTGPVEAPVLCNGRDSLRFAAQSAGGNVTGIPSLVLETGFTLLLIDGRCRYYAMTAPDQEVRTGVLAATDAQSLSSDFLLGHWQGLERAGFGCPDAGSQAFAFAEDRAESSCTTTPLTSALALWLERLYDAGSKVSGAVRYGVVEASDSAWPDKSQQSALTYPFKDPAPIATDPFVEMKVQVASGADAETLRELRAAYQSSTKPVPAPSYGIPVKVEGPDEAFTYYNLVIRDTVPFEIDGVLAIEDFIE